MKVVNNENTAYFDCDDTLVLYVDDSGNPKDEFITLDFYGEKKRLKVHQAHVSFLKSLKKRGFEITVWSGNGNQWAAEVCKKLGLEDYVDYAKGKPSKVIDDMDSPNWIKTIFITKEHM